MSQHRHLSASPSLLATGLGLRLAVAAAAAGVLWAAVLWALS